MPWNLPGQTISRCIWTLFACVGHHYTMKPVVYSCFGWLHQITRWAPLSIVGKALMFTSAFTNIAIQIPCHVVDKDTLWHTHASEFALTLSISNNTVVPLKRMKTAVYIWMIVFVLRLILHWFCIVKAACSFYSTVCNVSESVFRVQSTYTIH